ncbi:MULTISPECIES: hypothetical protein [Paraburkholderia]|jgi:hypothetical protein|uniref:Transmembrane protein n=1 Tax=Paraburkholderia phenazinium TaxID=60549 RepID=A0A1N6K7G3_9BURK|nr:hypothetical protein [Paraburkholderia phenazinium]SIO52495.1 hypothetical protein SAMN05444168_6283 [Paraburkholderia phenazinium]
MSSRQTQDGQNTAQQHTPLQIRLYVASAVILVVGLIGAAIIYVAAPARDSAELIYGVANNQQYLLELQRIGGTAEVALAEFHQWFDSLWHGKPLAYTVAFLCVVLAGACILAARSRFFEPAYEETDDQD